jgi:hypothetical protein
MTYWCGSGSGSTDPCLWLIDPDPDSDADPDPAIYSSLTFKMLTKTNILKSLLLITFWRYTYITFQRKKVKKKSQSSRNQGFSYYFCLVIEGPGSKPQTNGSGSGSRRPKNIRIRQIRIRIRNTSRKYSIPARHLGPVLHLRPLKPNVCGSARQATHTRGAESFSVR